MPISKRAEIIHIPPEKYITIPSAELYSVLLEGLSNDDVIKYGDLCRLVEGSVKLDFWTLRDRLEATVQPFSAAVNGVETVRRKGAEPVSDSAKKEQEQQFMEDFFSLMHSAEYQVMTADEWVAAQKYEFLLNLPVAVNYDVLESNLLPGLWAKHAEIRTELPEHADQILIFHRGVSQLTPLPSMPQSLMKGRYINDKVDLLLEYLVADPARQLWFKIQDKLVAKKILKRPLLVPEPEPERYMPTDEPQHVHTKVVARQTLEILFPTVLELIKGFIGEVELMEPSFKDVVIVYRLKAPEKYKPASENEIVMQYNPEAAKWNINIKRFKDIPLADIEMVFPDKKVYIKPLTLIQLAITLIGGIIAAVTMLLKSEVSPALLFSAVSLVGGRVAAVYSSLQAKVSDIKDQMNKMMFKQTLDAQEGVLYFVLQEMEDQIVKQAMLAYTLLLTLSAQGQQLDEQGLDTQIESFLDSHFGVKLDFSVEKALAKLISDGIVTRDSQTGILTAVPVADALVTLDKKWDNYFQFYSAVSAPSAASGIGALMPSLSAITSAGDGPAKHKSLSSSLRKRIFGTSRKADALAKPAPAYYS